MSGLTRGGKTLVGASIASAAIVWFIHWSEEEARRRMKAGPVRDKIMYEKKAEMIRNGELVAESLPASSTNS
eukprot:gene25883-11558_t